MTALDRLVAYSLVCGTLLIAAIVSFGVPLP